MLGELNQRFKMADHQGMFFTIWYGVYDDRTRTLDWSGGGHPPAVLLSDGEAPDLLDSDGPMVGAVDGMSYETRQCKVAPGSRLLLYSDGIYEIKRPDGTLWSLEEFVKVVEEYLPDQSRSIDSIIGTARGISEKDMFDDDCSVVEFMFD